MGGRDRELPLAPIDRLIHKAGAERVSEEASQALRDILERLGEEIAREAIELAKHAGRKTVTRGDIEYAARRITRVYMITS
ncbi:MAG: histone [Thermofilum sp. ex4484_15]|nr:MAG: histone [Thermofilum sp. ex4484_15]